MTTFIKPRAATTPPPSNASPTEPRGGRRPGKLRTNLALSVATALCLLTGAYAVALAASGFRFLPSNVAANGLPLAVQVHVVLAGIALLLVPWQLWPHLRQRGFVHRWCGRGYAVAAIGGGASGLLAAFTTQAGPIAAAGFALLGILWVVTTVLAVIEARRGNVSAHRRWALRSFALAFAAVTLRLYIPLGMGFGIDFDQAYVAIAWLCWVPNILVCELFLARDDVDRSAFDGFRRRSYQGAGH